MAYDRSALAAWRASHLVSYGESALAPVCVHRLDLRFAEDEYLVPGRDGQVLAWILLSAMMEDLDGSLKLTFGLTGGRLSRAWVFVLRTLQLSPACSRAVINLCLSLIESMLQLRLRRVEQWSDADPSFAKEVRAGCARQLKEFRALRTEYARQAYDGPGLCRR